MIYERTLHTRLEYTFETQVGEKYNMGEYSSYITYRPYGL